MKKLMHMKSVFIVVAGLMASGCASIMSGRHQEVTFQSSPDGATVTVAGRVIGKTPITTSIEKRSGQALVFSKDGFLPVSMSLETRLNSWFWGNIVFGGLIGSSTDGITGSVYEYSPSQYMVSLQASGSNSVEGKVSDPARQKAKEFILISYKDILSDLRKGEGQYLSSFLKLLNVPDKEKDDAAKKIRSLSDVYSNISEFADRVIEIYIK